MELWEIPTQGALDAWMRDEDRKKQLVREGKFEEARTLPPTYKPYGRGLTEQELFTTIAYTLAEGYVFAFILPLITLLSLHMN